MFGTRARARKITEKPLSHTYMIHECELFSGRHHTHFYAFTYTCARVCAGARACVRYLRIFRPSLPRLKLPGIFFFFFAFPPPHYFQVTRVLGVEKYSCFSRMCYQHD